MIELKLLSLGNGEAYEKRPSNALTSVKTNQSS